MDRGGPFEILGVPARDVARIVVRDMEDGVLEIRLAALVISALEREEHELHAAAHAIDEVADPVDVGAVDAAGRIVHAARIQEEKAPRVLPGIEHALRARVHEDAAARVAGADEMRMAVPDLRDIDAVPGALDELVIGEMTR